MGNSHPPKLMRLRGAFIAHLPEIYAIMQCTLDEIGLGRPGSLAVLQHAAKDLAKNAQSHQLMEVVDVAHEFERLAAELRAPIQVTTLYPKCILADLLSASPLLKVMRSN